MVRTPEEIAAIEAGFATTIRGGVLPERKKVAVPKVSSQQNRGGLSTGRPGSGRAGPTLQAARSQSQAGLSPGGRGQPRVGPTIDAASRQVVVPDIPTEQPLFDPNIGQTIAQQIRDRGTSAQLPTPVIVEPPVAAPRASGFANVIDVLGIGLNPFDSTKISANTQSTIVNAGLELAANNPLTTALVLTVAHVGLTAGLTAAGLGGTTTATKLGVGQAVKGPLGSWGFTSSVASTGGAVAVSVAGNTATQKLTGNLLAKAGFTVAAALFIANALGTYPFAKFEVAESMDKLGYARSKAAQEGRTDLVDGLNQLQDEILNPVGWDFLFSVLPGANILRAAQKNIDAAVASTKVFDAIVQDDIQQQATGESDADRWDRVRKEQAIQDNLTVDYYNDQRTLMITWENEAKAAAKAASREEDIKARNEDAKFWAEQAAKQRELEAQDRQAIADFWAAYRKNMLKIADNNRPSNLKFGLL